MINCIAIDDEPLALEQIKRYIAKVPELDLKGAFLSAHQATELINGGEVDLLLLDIDMPDCNGMDYARSLINPPYIIFTTAYPQYAVEGFRVDAVDYLLKPLSFDELLVAVEKVKRRMSVKAQDKDTEIYVKESGVMHKIKVSDIKYVKGLGEYIKIAVEGEKSSLITFDSIKRFESQLLTANFMRIHKSYLVNLDLITEANRQWVKIGDESIPVGDKYRKNLVEYLKSK